MTTTDIEAKVASGKANTMFLTLQTYILYILIHMMHLDTLQAYVLHTYKITWMKF